MSELTNYIDNHAQSTLRQAYAGASPGAGVAAINGDYAAVKYIDSSAPGKALWHRRFSMNTLSIRTLLLLLVVAGAVALAASVGYHIHADMQQDIASTKAALRTLAITMSGKTGSKIVNARQTLERLAERPLVKQVNANHCDGILQDLLYLNPDYTNATYTSIEGVAVCSAVPQPDGKPVNVGNAPWFQKFVKDQRFTVGEPFLGPITGKWVSVLSAPIWNEHHQMVGGVQLPLDLNSYDPLIPIQYLPTGSRYGFMSEDGILMWRNVDPEGVIGQRKQSEAARQMIVIRDGEFESVGSDGVRRFFSVVPMPEARWVAFVGVPAVEVYARARERAMVAMAIALAAITLLILLVLAITRKIAEPIAALERAARSVFGGNLGAKVTPEGPREIVSVATAFNAMTDKIEASTRQLEAEIAERKLADRVLCQSRQMFSTAFESCPVAASIATMADGRFIEANGNYERDFGWTKSDMIGKTSVEIGFWPDQAARVPWVESMRRSGRLVNYEVVWKCKNGERRHVSLSSELIELDGQSCIVAYATDITVRKSAEAELRIAAAAFESQECMMITNADSVILKVNQAFVETTGYAADEVVGRTPGLLKSGRHNADFYREMWETINKTGGWQGEVWDRRKNGEEYPKWLTISAVKGDEGVVTHYIGSHFDITERKNAEDKINELAYFDQLTRLPNRTLLQDRLKQVMTASSRNETHGALLFIDLDNFKTLNDTHGHDMGDLLLKQVAQHLMACVREGDTVARLGGDEFVVMLANLSVNEEEAAIGIETVAEKILATLDQSYLLNHVAFRSTASIGITLFRGQLTSVDDLMKQADLAMYKAKEAGRNTFRFFDPHMEAAVKERMALEEDLRRAIDAKQFILYYQAQVVGDGQVTGAEVLVRWQHPTRGMVSPAAFIPLAEETGLILPLGNWVLETACTQLAVWATQPAMAHLTVAVNVSAHQFRQADFVDRVLVVLKNTGANPQQLKLELTESLLVENVQDIIEKMHALKAKGVGFSLDDFGTGYSSLSYLKRLPLYQLKIDQSFVRDVLTDPNDAAIAKTVVSLAQSLGLGVIAEGVETGAQKAFLADSGCHAYQGYLFSKPLPVEGFEEFARQEAMKTPFAGSP